VPGWGESGSGERARYPAFRAAQLAEATRRNELLANAKGAGFGGDQKHTVTGDASLTIGLNGFPKGTKTDLTYGGLFTEYT
jgi:hypothetical protein